MADLLTVLCQVGDDLAAYLAESEQVNCALALGVSINRDLSVRAAGGYLLQVGTQHYRAF